LAKDPKDASEKEVKTPDAASKKNSVIIDINPTLESASVDLLKFNKTAVITLLRMSPPTKAHDVFIDNLYDVATAHSVEQPLVYIQDADNVAISPDEEGDDFVWLSADDAYALATEAYGDIVQSQPITSINEVILKALETYTEVVVVLPEAAAKAIRFDEHNVNIVSYSALDEAALAEKMYGYTVDGNAQAFQDELSEGLDYLAQEIIDIYQTYTADDIDDVYEALTYGQRLKRAQVFKRNKRKIALARDRMRRKIATTDQLKVRARHKAIQSIRKKVAGARGADYNNLSVGEKVQIDKRVEQRKGSIGRIAQKILPQLRKQESQKIAALHKKPTHEDFNPIKAMTSNELNDGDTSPDLKHSASPLKRKQQIMHHRMEHFDASELPSNQARELPVRVGDAPAEKKRWHSMFNKDGSIKLDKRFKIWRDANIEEMVDAVLDPEVSEIIEAVVAKGEEYNIDQEVIKEVFFRGAADIAYEHLDPVQAGFNRVNSFIAGSYFLEDLSLMEAAEEGACAIITQAELKELEKFADALLDKFGIDIAFTKHFGERMSDNRNSPCIKVQELRDIFRKIALKQGRDIKSARAAEVVLKDIQKNLNIPVVINYKRGEFEVVLKTIMRKKNFGSPDPIINV
jgi:hypothetical protein